MALVVKNKMFIYRSFYLPYYTWSINKIVLFLVCCVKKWHQTVHCLLPQQFCRDDISSQAPHAGRPRRSIHKKMEISTGILWWARRRIHTPRVQTLREHQYLSEASFWTLKKDAWAALCRSESKRPRTDPPKRNKKPEKKSSWGWRIEHECFNLEKNTEINIIHINNFIPIFVTYLLPERKTTV